MRLIDADALIYGLRDYMFTLNPDDLDATKEYSLVSKMIEILENAPTIEPERKKGRWIFDEKDFLTKCSECGFHPWIGVIPTIEEATKKLPHCPKCLAKMEENDEDR